MPTIFFKMKFKTYKGEVLHNVEVSLKIDGIRAHKTANGIVSRANKPLYNISLDCDVAEVFLGSWEETVSAVRTHKGSPVKNEFIYSLIPLDPRLYLGTFEVLSPEDVTALFQDAISKGYEGIVLKSNGTYFKVKPEETYDIKVLGVIGGKGRNSGRLGALVTEMGNVGTGFTDEQRKIMFNKNIIGSTIEVSCMGLTPSGKFRHPRFIRERFDK